MSRRRDYRKKENPFDFNQGNKAPGSPFKKSNNQWNFGSNNQQKPNNFGGQRPNNQMNMNSGRPEPNFSAPSSNDYVSCPLFCMISEYRPMNRDGSILMTSDEMKVFQMLHQGKNPSDFNITKVGIMM